MIDLSGATTIAAGGYYTCGLLTGGTVDCWGDNYYGELGNGTTTDSSTPIAVSDLSGVTAITAGVGHTCAILTGGSADCWGENAEGDLGDGTVTESNTPVPVTGLSNSTAIAAGYYYTCALLTGGSADCWGSNYYGQLGNGTTTELSMIPVAVNGLGEADAIATGGFHACALLTRGTVDCWGDNATGDLGDGSTTESTTPVAVSIP